MDPHDQIMEWFEKNNIKQANPESISQNYLSLQRSSLKNSDKSSSISLNNSLILLRRSRNNSKEEV
jgi:hypothetical protein